jgi:hypothetical protein
MLSGWFVMVTVVAAITVLLPLSWGNVPELGYAATFVIFGGVLSASYFVGFIGLESFLKFSNAFVSFPPLVKLGAGLCLFTLVAIAVEHTLSGPSANSWWQEALLYLPSGAVVAWLKFPASRAVEKR